MLQHLFPDVRKPDLQVLTLSAHEILRDKRSVEGADDLEATKYEIVIRKLREVLLESSVKQTRFNNASQSEYIP